MTDLIAFNVLLKGHLVNLFVIHDDNVLTASVSVISSRVKAHGPFVTFSATYSDVFKK